MKQVFEVDWVPGRLEASLVKGLLNDYLAHHGWSRHDLSVVEVVVEQVAEAAAQKPCPACEYPHAAYSHVCARFNQDGAA